MLEIVLVIAYGSYPILAHFILKQNKQTCDMHACFKVDIIAHANSTGLDKKQA